MSNTESRYSERLTSNVDSEVMKMAKLLANKKRISISALIRTLIVDCYKKEND